jgi:UDP-N-acetylglucosamine acyltransferase
MAVHPSAIVEDGARLGAGVEVGPFCIVGRGVELGDHVRLLSHAVISGRTAIGARTIVHPQTVLGGSAQIRGDNFAEARLVVGADCVFREGVTISAGSRAGGGATTIGDRVYFMAYSHVGHDCHVGSDVTFANNATIGGHVTVGDFVFMGGLSAVQQRGRVGRGAMIGGVTGVNRDVIPYGEAYGDHAILAGINLIGLKRRGVSRANINAIRAAFRAIFLEQGGSTKERALRTREQWPAVDEVAEIVDFILAPAKQALCTPRHAGRRAEDDG